ncbi:MAG: DUF2247 family protein [Eggerthellaceae bacterium]|jgi:hypothetical protein|nr:DUF2247 family protein [Eggerthellaceae bacterium]
MYSFAVFKKSGIEPQACAVVYGIQAGLLPASAVPEFEEYMITDKQVDGVPELLIFEGSPEEATATLSKAGYVDDGRGCDILRYAILASLDSEGQELLDDVESVYADFGYPHDMEPFIYYMPSEGDSSTDDLVKRYREFLVSEKVRLGL